jgi:hypothetical protein
MPETFAPTLAAAQARLAAVRPAAYVRELPTEIRQGCTGVPVIDEAVYALYANGTLHNHARMGLASYVVHVRKVHWRAGADWLYSHLLDGDLASNHLSWQWVAGTSRPQALPVQRRERGTLRTQGMAQPGQRDRHVLRGTRPHGTPASEGAAVPVGRAIRQPVAGRAATRYPPARRSGDDQARRRQRDGPRRLAFGQGLRLLLGSPSPTAPPSP